MSGDSETTLTIEEVQRRADAWAEEAWDPEITVAEWWRRMAEAGYSASMLPPELGGLGYGRDLANAALNALGRRNVLGPPNGLGLMLAAPTIAVHGTPQQQAEFIGPILRGEHAWCQLFSEPGAGSDLASLQTKAELDGDEYVISGQKVWTSGGQLADYGMLLARTDPNASKHQGITWFAFDMRQPGVDVRPLREMTGRALFNEVFIDEARVPAANVVGGLNNGWAVANTTLMVERASLGSSAGAGLGTAHPGQKGGHLTRKAGDFVGVRGEVAAAGFSGSSVHRYAQLARSRGLADAAVIRQGLAQLHILTELNRLNVMRARAGSARTGGEGNIAKLLSNITLRLAREVGNQIIGPHGTLWGEDALSGGAVQELTVFSPAPAIYGGTDQIQKNILGERVLGLPKEPKPA